jgi:VWFA-related protein
VARPGLALGLLLAGVAAAVAQEPVPAPAPAAQPPVFEASVDIVAVDVSVVDAQGRPVLGLAPEDFTLEVDGRPRPVVSAEYVGRELEPSAPRPRPAHYSTNEGVAAGRLVLVLVDRGSIGRGGVRRVQDAADRFLSTLAPADRVGLASMPGPPPSVEFTEDHAKVRQALKQVVGLATEAGRARVPLAVAVAYAEGIDRMRWDLFVTPQCADEPTDNQRELCERELEVEATQVYQSYQERARSSLAHMRAAFDGLRGIEGPKTVVLLTEGLGGEIGAELKDLAQKAGEAQVTLFVLLLDAPGMNMAADRPTPVSREDRELETGSIYGLASLARGTVLRVSGSADQPFQRIARELMGYYLVGFTPEPGDRDGKSHRITARVARERATVRARGVMHIPVEAPGPQQLVAAALRSPFVEQGLVLKVTSYARPAPGGKVKLLLAAVVEGARRPVSVGYALFDAGGKAVASRLLQGIETGDAARVPFAAEAIVDPGSYALRLAALDAAGRRGSVHHETKAALVSAGGLQVSDLVLAPFSSDALTPAVDLEMEAAGLVAMIEVASQDKAALAKASVAVEVAESAEGQALLHVPLQATPADADGIRVARATLGGGLLPPGDYVARAAVSVGDKPVASLTRPFRIATPRAGAPAVRAPLAGLLTEARPYDRRDLLTPEVLSYFLDRMNEIAQGPHSEALTAAVEEARQGRPEAMLGRLSGESKEDPRVAFLRGVAYHAGGNLSAALTQLQLALRARSDFFPAAVYMGACYAAGGKDADAIGAWQTALIGESGSPALYVVLSDALLRTGEAAEAVAILDEGHAAFPQDEGLRRRLGLAHALAGHSEQALTLLTSWVDAHPEDTQALFATLALLFDGFSREAAGGAKLEEQQRLRRYAKAYVASNGPNREIVERWLRYLDSRAGG